MGALRRKESSKKQCQKAIPKSSSKGIAFGMEGGNGTAVEVSTA
jgi:hypothetical protein